MGRNSEIQKLWANEQVRHAVLSAVESNSTICEQYAICATKEQHESFTLALRHVLISQEPSLTDGYDLNFPSGIQVIAECIGRARKQEGASAYHNIAWADLQRKQIKQRNRNRMVHAASSLGVKPQTGDGPKLWQTVPQREVKRLADQDIYPDFNAWMIETDEIDNMWRPYLQNRKPPDSRRSLPHFIRVQLDRLKYDVKEDESIIFVDADGKIVLAIFRNFVGNHFIINWLDSIAKEAVKARKSIRLEDPGKIVILGYSAGARSRPLFGWARNFLSRYKSEDNRNILNRRAAEAFAVTWRLFCDKLPPSVIEDIISWLRRSEIPKMKPAGAEDNIRISLGNTAFSLRNNEWAPPMGMMAINYSRAVHKENQPHEYAISLTTSRSHPGDAGGHFYVARYGIRVRAAADTAIVWRPADEHGTSLQLFPPETTVVPDFRQAGLAIVTSNRITSIWQKFATKEINETTAAALSVEDENDSNDDTLLPDLTNEDDDIDECEIECIVDQVGKGKHAEFRVRWKGYDAKDDLWLAKEDLKECAALDEWFKRKISQGRK